MTKASGVGERREDVASVSKEISRTFPRQTLNKAIINLLSAGNLLSGRLRGTGGDQTSCQ
jgi:hypothetical protein